MSAINRPESTATAVPADSGTSSRAMPPAAPDIRLLPPGPMLLPSYAAALERGWSPDLNRDVSREQLEILRADPAAYLRDLTCQDAMVTLDDGREVPRLPFRLAWIWDGEFCGAVNFRFQPGTEALPAHVSGHIGYIVVPWKRQRGYATRALALILPQARSSGLRRVSVTCDEDNLASRRVIEANGGVFAGRAPHPRLPDAVKLQFWIRL
jgi:predicted acetyltransferase